MSLSNGPRVVDSDRFDSEFQAPANQGGWEKGTGTGTTGLPSTAVAGGRLVSNNLNQFTDDDHAEGRVPQRTGTSSPLSPPCKMAVISLFLI